jgi:2-methylcitrate dehydratase PrpD
MREQGARGKNSAEHFAEFAAGLRFSDLPMHVQEASKLILLDTLGVGIAASSVGVGCSEALEYVRTCFGCGGSVIWGSCERTSMIGAAFANGALAHALNFDALGVGYVGLIAPAVIAAADSVATVTGPELLSALVVGGELSARVHRVTEKGAHGTVLDGQLQSYFGCAVGAAKVMRMSAAAIYDTLGLALMQSAGSVQVVLEGDPPAKAIYGAFPNQGGLQAALLARSGMNAGCNAFDGNGGLFPHHYGQRDSSEMLIGLGTKYLIEAMTIKPWPTSAALFPLIEAAIVLANKHDFVAREIETVRIVAPRSLRMWFEPEALRRAPPNAAAAANSMFFTVAKALSKRSLTLDDFTSSGLADPEAAGLAQKIEVQPAFNPEQGMSITVITQAGIRSSQAAVSESSTFRATSRVEIENKFRNCIQYAANPTLRDRGDALIATITNLDEVRDCNDLTRLLA